MDTHAIDIYVQALVDIANALERHREARTAFEPGFLHRVLRDGFLQPLTESDKERVLFQSRPHEEFLIWKGPVRGQKMNWNCLGWIFPFYRDDEIENAYEIIIRSELDQKSWAVVRQFILSCRIRWKEMPFEVPANILKVRVLGDDCQAAMQTLESYPPNLRYVVNTMMEQLPASNYLWKRIQMQVVIGATLQPYIDTSKTRQFRTAS